MHASFVPLCWRVLSYKGKEFVQSVLREDEPCQEVRKRVIEKNLTNLILYIIVLEKEIFSDVFGRVIETLSYLFILFLQRKMCILTYSEGWLYLFWYSDTFGAITCKTLLCEIMTINHIKFSKGRTHFICIVFIYSPYIKAWQFLNNFQKWIYTIFFHCSSGPCSNFLMGKCSHLASILVVWFLYISSYICCISLYFRYAIFLGMLTILCSNFKLLLLLSSLLRELKPKVKYICAFL